MELEVGGEHDCYHPEDAYSMVRYLNGQTLAVPRYEGAINSFYLTLRGTVHGRQR